VSTNPYRKQESVFCLIVDKPRRAKLSILAMELGYISHGGNVSEMIRDIADGHLVVITAEEFEKCLNK